MKKVLLAIAVATFFAACSDNSTTSTTATDSTAVKNDSLKSPVDTTTKMTTTPDTSKMSTKDTTHKK